MSWQGLRQRGPPHLVNENDQVTSVQCIIALHRQLHREQVRQVRAAGVQPDGANRCAWQAVVRQALEHELEDKLFWVHGGVVDTFGGGQ